MYVVSLYTDQKLAVVAVVLQNCYLLALSCISVQWSSNLFLDEVQVLGQHQAVLLHHRPQVIVCHQVVKHG